MSLASYYLERRIGSLFHCSFEDYPCKFPSNFDDYSPIWPSVRHTSKNVG
jgi:hypothetical protein